ncbi:MAG: hypothetical protein A3G93_16495 [Nitrospinae bacterium RIFCSPLOWO2_12_FULL_45_22]|nr:MAG: hypothetical protein A3G93_16495 [Nitrospinae bacterium RIFCSPLOWO2_12_FULL_45_22]
MKVAYFLDVFPKLSETFILNEIIELKKLGLDIIIFSLARPDEEVMHQEAAQLLKDTHYPDNITLSERVYAHLNLLIHNPLRYLKAFWFAYSRDAAAFSKFKRAAHYALELKKVGVEHIHAHFAAAASEYAMLISMISGIPYSFTVHAYDLFIKPRLIREKAHFSEFVVSKTDFNRRFIRERYAGVDESKLHLVHLGINTEKFALAGSCRDKETPFTILSVARLIEKKGLRYLFEACSILDKQGLSNFICKIIGDGPLKNDLEDLAWGLGLKHRVEFLGSLTIDEVIFKLGGADVFVLPCVVAKDGDIDGMPNVLLEAMALERPVISTYVSGIPELIRDGAGILVPPEDPETLAQAINKIYLMTPESKKEMGQKGREIIEREFNIVQETKKLQNLFLATIK